MRILSLIQIVETCFGAFSRAKPPGHSVTPELTPEPHAAEVPRASNNLGGSQPSRWLRPFCRFPAFGGMSVYCNPIRGRDSVNPQPERFGTKSPVSKSISMQGHREKSPQEESVVSPLISPIDAKMQILLGLTCQAELATEINRRVRDASFNPSHLKHSRPSWYKWSTLTQEYIPKSLVEGSFYGNKSTLVHLGSPPIYRAFRTAVFSIRELFGKVIKYYMYCESVDDPLDAIVLESFFMEKLASQGICPHVYYYSDYMTWGLSRYPFIPQLRTGKILQTKCNEEPTKPPNIRYMIMEKVGISVEDWATGYALRRPFIDVMRVGAQMIVLLEKLHDLNILHGDAHWGNFAFKSGMKGDLVIIDFGRSRIINEKLDYGGKTPKDDEGFCEGSDWLHVNTGKWEMKSCNPAFRDDVYRAVQNCAMAIYGSHLRAYLDSIAYEDSPDVDRYKTVKNAASFFEIPPDTEDKNGFSLEGWVPDDKLGLIRAELRKISDETARNNDNPLTKPAYAKIIESYKNIIVLLDPDLEGKPHSEIFSVV